MILKEYQKTALQAVRTFLDLLVEWRGKEATAREIDPDITFDWVTRAWEKAGTARAYLPRKNGLGEPLPTFCLKIPTGGGKTLLATKVIDLVNTHYRRQQAGLVLWIVPTTQIYNQTLKALKDRDHPYRQQLDVSSAGKTLILEKNSGFKPQDVRERLCVLLLMLPSANRATKEQLRMFRDSGGFERFFPREDDASAQEKLLSEVPNLDTFASASGVWGRQAKTSLGNTLRLLRPLIILDEGHKAYSVNAKKTLEGFNPSMIVELSATPPRQANVLVAITGQALNAEEMIKLDLNIHNKASVSWQDTLLAAIEHRATLEAKAREHQAQTGAYIRPICLVQVERTGKEQRQAGLIHAEDVREHLLRHPAISAEQVAVKTSARDELKEVDEAGGLLSRECPIRFIITKQALQEGWDCSFAYVLAILTNPGSQSALTQLVGRILRQPYASKTHVRELDESYVFCFQRRGSDLLREVRKGFGLEGLQGLEGRVKADAEDQPGGLVVSEQRQRFRQAAANLVLPTFMIRDGRRWRLVHYEADILSRVPWDEVDVTPLFALDLQTQGNKDATLRAGLDFEPLFTDVDDIGEPASTETGIDTYFAASHLLDAMPNPWRGAEATEQVFNALLAKHPREQVLANTVFILEELRKRLGAERDRLSRQVFAQLPGRRHDALHRRHRRLAVQPFAAAHRVARDRAPSQPRRRQPVPARPLRARERRRVEWLGEQGGHLPRPPSPPLLLVPQPRPQGLLRARLEAPAHLRRLHLHAQGRRAAPRRRVPPSVRGGNERRPFEGSGGHRLQALRVRHLLETRQEGRLGGLRARDAGQGGALRGGG